MVWNNLINLCVNSFHKYHQVNFRWKNQTPRVFYHLKRDNPLSRLANALIDRGSKNEPYYKLTYLCYIWSYFYWTLAFAWTINQVAYIGDNRLHAVVGLWGLAMGELWQLFKINYWMQEKHVQKYVAKINLTHKKMACIKCFIVKRWNKKN